MNTTQRITDVQVCAAVRDTQATWPAAALMDTPAQRLHRRTGQSLDACKRAVHRAYDDGLLDDGVSNSRYVLTAAGESLLPTWAAKLSTLTSREQLEEFMKAGVGVGMYWYANEDKVEWRSDPIVVNDSGEAASLQGVVTKAEAAALDELYMDREDAQ